MSHDLKDCFIHDCLHVLKKADQAMTCQEKAHGKIEDAAYQDIRVDMQAWLDWIEDNNKNYEGLKKSLWIDEQEL